MLVAAAQRGNLPVVAFLLEECRVKANASDDHERTVRVSLFVSLVQSLHRGLREAERIGGTKVGIQYGKTHSSAPSQTQALHSAALNGHLGVVEYLVGRHRVPPNLKTRGGATPLMLACAKNQLAVSLLPSLLVSCA